VAESAVAATPLILVFALHILKMLVMHVGWSPVHFVAVMSRAHMLKKRKIA
jgi:hypothetical protein